MENKVINLGSNTSGNQLLKKLLNFFFHYRIIPDYKRPGLLCLALPSCQKSGLVLVKKVKVISRVDCIIWQYIKNPSETNQVCTYYYITTKMTYLRIVLRYRRLLNWIGRSWLTCAWTYSSQWCNTLKIGKHKIILKRSLV